MAGESGRRQLEPVADFTDGQPFGTGLHQQAVGCQPGVVGQCFQGLDGYCLFHSLETIKLFIALSSDTVLSGK